MSRYTNFSAAVYACLEEAAFSWFWREWDPKVLEITTLDVAVRWFAAKLEDLKKEISQLKQNNLLRKFASQYDRHPEILERENCASFHELALKEAEAAFRRVMEAAYGTERLSGRGLPQTKNPLPVDVGDISINAQQIEERWDAVFPAMTDNSIDLKKWSGKLKDELVRTERAAGAEAMVRWCRSRPVSRITPKASGKTRKLATKRAEEIRKAADDDSSSWVLITKLQPPRIKNIKMRRRYIDKHSAEIRARRPLTKAGKPHPKRLEVHIGDWVKHWDKVDNEAFNSLDSAEPEPLTNVTITDGFMDSAVRLYAKVFQDKRRRK